MSIDAELVRKANLRARGRCERCKAGAGDTVAELKGGAWARWSYAAGFWVGRDGAKLTAGAVDGRREDVVRITVVRAASHAHVLIAGRMVALCQPCAHAATVAPPAPQAEQGTFDL